MKNVHVLPTEKPSRLFEDDLQLYYSKDKNRIGSIISNKHIYITSDEEIKDGDWCLVLNSKKEYLIEKYSFHSDCIIAKKIIITDNKNLIKDGVQAIDDEFLEWFVKNPNCESVEVSYEVLKPFQSEEKGYLIHCPDNEVLEEPKQETIREVVKRYYEDNIDESNIPREHYEWEIQDLMIGFAYQWQQEQDKNKYSEEDMKKCWDACLDFNKPAGFDNGIPFNEFLKDLKK